MSLQDAAIVQAFASLLTFLATFALLCITWRYTKATKKTADVMAQDYETRVKSALRCSN